MGWKRGKSIALDHRAARFVRCAEEKIALGFAVRLYWEAGILCDLFSRSETATMSRDYKLIVPCSRQRL